MLAVQTHQASRAAAARRPLPFPSSERPSSYAAAAIASLMVWTASMCCARWDCGERQRAEGELRYDDEAVSRGPGRESGVVAAEFASLGGRRTKTFWKRRGVSFGRRAAAGTRANYGETGKSVDVCSPGFRSNIAFGSLTHPGIGEMLRLIRENRYATRWRVSK